MGNDVEDSIAWRNFLQAHEAHHGHDEAGQGSPITQIVLDHYALRYAEIWDGLGSKKNFPNATLDQ